jgi:hypothetical protein
MENMNRTVILLLFFGFASLLPMAAYPASAETVVEASDPRQELWQGLLSSWPHGEKPIDVYAENDQLTIICFRSGGQTYLFHLKSGKVEHVTHAKRLPSKINRITFEQGNSFGSFTLWHYNSPELSIGAAGEQ